jgi:protein-S-isoprenylcysteine O-methyltransferase Ste14
MNYLIVPIGWLQFCLFWGLAILFFTSLIRALAQRTPESGGRREGKSRIGIILQSIGFFFAGFGGVRIALPLLGPAALAGALAVLLLMGGPLFLFAASSSALGKNWSLETRTRDDHQLIRNGPYARVRHPIYLGMLLFLLGLAVALGPYAQLILAVPIFLVGTTIRTRIEDGLLETQFGDDFRSYARSTPALIPGFR